MSPEPLDPTSTPPIPRNIILKTLSAFTCGVCLAGMATLLAFRSLEKVPRSFWIAAIGTTFATFVLCLLFLTLQRSRSVQTRDYWFIEMWTEDRELFKTLIRHVFGFSILYGAISAGHYLSNHSDLPEQRKALLDVVHFYSLLAWLGVFSLSFIIKALKLEYVVMRKSDKRR